MKKKLLFILMLIIVCNTLFAQIFGIDINAEKGKIGWLQVGKERKAFAYIKATKGMCYIDSKFGDNIIYSKGVIKGAYHYALPEDNPNAVDEANYFLSAAGAYIGSGYLPPALDLEGPEGTCIKHNTKLSTYFNNNISALAQWVRDWVTTVYNQKHVMPVLYVDRCYAGLLYPYYISGTIPSQCKLWIADYGPPETPGNPTNSSKCQPWIGWPWVFMQYSEKGKVAGIYPIDLDVFNGDSTAFKSLIWGVNCTDNFESNNSYQTAHSLFQSPLSNNTQNTTINSSISAGSDQDWYSLNISRTGILTIDLKNMSADFDMELYGINGSNNQAIGVSYNSGITAEAIVKNHSIDESTVWYIKVYPKNSSQITQCGKYTLTISWQPTTIAPEVPPGSYKKIEMYGLKINPITNDLEFMFHTYPAQAGDPVIDIAQECAMLKKIFKTALVTPFSKQWISIDPLPEYFTHSWGNVVKPNAPYPFRNSEMANRMFMADLYLKEFWDANFRVDAMNYWKSLVLQSPYWNSLHQKGFDNYAFYPGRACIIPGPVSVNTTSNSIQINQASLGVESENYHTPYILPGVIDLSLLTQQEKNDLNNRLLTFDNWVTNAFANRETPFKNLLNSHSVFKNIRQIYTTIALAKQYKQWNYSNKPMANFFDSEYMIGISDPMIPDQTIVDLWNQSFTLVPAFNQNGNFIDFNGNSLHFSHGGCVMYSVNPIDLGALNSIQIARDSVVFKNRSWINQDSTTYFYGGILDYPIAELSGTIQSQNTNHILGDTILIETTIYNLGNTYAQQFPVRLYEQYRNNQNKLQNILIGQQTISSIDSLSTKIITFNWIPVSYGGTKLLLTIDEGNQVVERNENNNTAKDSLFIQNNIPSVEILSPANGSSIGNKNIELSGIAFDLKEGYLSSNKLSWTSSVDGFLGNGSSLIIDSLTCGNQTINFTATNSNAKSSSKNINIYVFKQGFPFISINSPNNEDTLANNTNGVFSGSANDTDDGSLCDSASWSSNINGVLGSGCVINHQLSIGKHIITFSAQNKSGKSSSNSIQINIVNGKPKITILQPISNSIYFQNQALSLQASAIDYPQGNISNAIKWYSNLQGYLGTGSNLSVSLIPSIHSITASIQDNAGTVDTLSVKPIFVKLNPPVPVIIKPTTNQVFLYHDTINFIGYANDLQDGVLHGNKLKWYSNIDGFLGLGDTLSYSNLSFGYHNISLEATDKDGADSTIFVNNIYIDAGIPIVSITQPTNGTNFFYGNNVTFKGNAIDPRGDIINNANKKWHSNIEGDLGIGDIIKSNSLSPGTHVITFSATDSDGFTSNTTIHLSIEPPHSPTISIYYPYTNNHFLHGSTIALRASAFDYEEGILNNNSISWTSSIDGNLGLGKVISISTLSPRVHTITATAIDTTQLTASTAIQIVVDQQKPVAHITSPSSGLVFSQGKNVTFTGTGNDFEDGILIGNSLQWVSNKDGYLGTGNIINTSSLSIGSHFIYLIATDSQNAKDTSTIFTTIQASNTVLLTKFSSGIDSISHLFPSNGGDTIVYISTPKTAMVLVAQAIINGLPSKQKAQWNHAKSVGGTGTEYGYSICNDRKGNSFVTGIFNSPSISFGTTTLTNNGGADIFVVKYDPSGNVIWAKSAGGNSIDVGNSICVDINGNSYVTGYFTSPTITFGSIILINDGDSDIFVVKYDPSGNVIWAKSIKGTSLEVGNSVSVDMDENFYITGRFCGSYAVFGSDTLKKTCCSSCCDFYVAKYDKNGNELWVKNSNGDAVGNSICVDINGNSYVTGSFFSSTITFGTTTLTNNGGADIFVAKYDTAGNVLWAKNTGGTNDDEGNSISMDSFGNSFVTGYFRSSTINLNSITLTNNGGADIFVVKYDTAGNVLWAKSAGGTSSDIGKSISIDANENSYVTGSFASSSIIFSDTTLINDSNSDVFVVKYDNIGKALWAKSAGGTNRCGNSISVDENGNSYVTGFFSSSITLDTTILTSTGAFDCFIAKLKNKFSRYPFNPFLDVSNNSTHEWNYIGEFKTSQITSDFSNEINNYITSHNGNPYNVLIPLKLHSDSAGILNIKNLDIQYSFTDTIKPTISASFNPNPVNENTSFTVNAVIKDNVSVDSATVLFNNVKYKMIHGLGDNYSVNFLSGISGTFPTKISAYDVNGLSTDTTLNLVINAAGIDLSVSLDDINISPNTLLAGDTGTVNCIVKNLGNTIANNVVVGLFIDNQLKSSQIVSISALGQTSLQFKWLLKLGQDSVVIKADPNNLIAETNENNNNVTKYILVKDIYPPIILEALTTPNPAFKDGSVLFKVKAIDSTSISSVQLNWLRQNISLTYNPTSTYYEGFLNADSIGLKTARIKVENINNISTSTFLKVQVLKKLPDLNVCSSDIQFTPTTAISGSNASIKVKVNNLGNVDVTSTNVMILVDNVNIGNLSGQVLHDSSAVFTFNWTISGGSHVFKVVVDSNNAVEETNETNNSAFQIHQFCPVASSYQITAQAIPSKIALGQSMIVQATSLPFTVNSTLVSNWNGQNITMPFNVLANAYETSITPANHGDYLIPVIFSDSNNVQANTFVMFKVVDSLPDISINSINAVYPVQPNINTTFSVLVSNNSMSSLSNIPIYLFSDNQVVDSTVISTLNAFDSLTLTLKWFSKIGSHQITAFIDPKNKVVESNELNNSKSILLNLQDNEAPIIQFIHTTSPSYQGGTVNIESYITDNDSVASVVLNFMGINYSMQYDNSSLTWKKIINTPTNGTYPIGITATDNSLLTAHASSSIIVNDMMPDMEVKAQNIIFTHIDSITNKVSSIINNNGAGIVVNAKIHLLIDGIIKDSTQISLNSGKSDTVRFTFNYPIGFYPLTISANPYNKINESNEKNNIATINIVIPDLIPPTTPVVTVNPNSWLSSRSFNVYWNQVYDNSGSITYEYSANGAVWVNVGANLSAIINADIEGINYVYVRAKDGYGNISNTGVGEMKYDNTSPNAPLIAEYHCGTKWTTHDSPYLEWLNPGDIGSGIKYFEVSIDNSSVNIGFNFNYHSTLPLGIHLLKVRAVDCVGHIGNWSNDITVYIDLDNPDCPEMESPTHPDQNVWYKNDSIVLFWNRPLETSSVTGFFYMLNHDSIFFADQSSYWLRKDSLIITALPSMDTSKIRLPDGIWYLHLSSQDSVGHLSSKSCSYRVNIDKTPPFTTANYQDTVLGCNYSFNLHSEDYTSGVANTFYRINSGSWIKDSIVHLNTAGLKLVEFYSIDLAGNTEKIDSVYVLLKNNLALTANKQNVSCYGLNDGKVSIIINKGTPPYNYLWNTSPIHSTATLYNLIAGLYSVTVTDNTGCIVDTTISISQPIKIPFTINPSDSVGICQGDSIMFTVNSAATLNYLWSTGATKQSVTLNQAGTYFVTVLDNYGCSATSKLIVSINPLPATPVVTQNVDTLLSSALIGNQWYKAPSSLITGAIYPKYVPVQNGNYYVVVTDVNNCLSLNSNAISFVLTGIVENSVSSHFTIRPNPANTAITIEISKDLQNSRLIITDLNGKELIKIQLLNRVYKIDISSLSNGLYFVKIINEKGFDVKKFIKE